MLQNCPPERLFCTISELVQVKLVSHRLTFLVLVNFIMFIEH